MTKRGRCDLPLPVYPFWSLGDLPLLWAPPFFTTSLRYRLESRKYRHSSRPPGHSIGRFVLKIEPTGPTENPPTPKRVDYLPCSSSGWSYTESQSEREREREKDNCPKKREPWRYHVIPYSLAEDALHASIIHGGHHLSSSYDAHTWRVSSWGRPRVLREKEFFGVCYGFKFSSSAPGFDRTTISYS